MTFRRQGEWSLPPRAPYLSAKKTFLIDEEAISFAESCLGIVEHYRLGELVGTTTAGTNGNITRFSVPGQLQVVFTGMKVLKHDGSQHHGIGILPTIPVRPTLAGITAGRDEQFERALAVVKAARSPRH
jgi:C-terminal processing protease CtpA/Prc